MALITFSPNTKIKSAEVNSNFSTLNALIVASGGWVDTSETWTYSSADAPSFVANVPSGAAGKYTVGMRVKLTQSAAIKYFIITAITDTSLTLYGGTDYTLANATISDNYFSMSKVPFSFPASPTKWTVEVTDADNNLQSNPTQSVWYNLGSNSISIPVGLWSLEYLCEVGTRRNSGGYMSGFATLSTTSNSESDIDLTSAWHAAPQTTGDQWEYQQFYRRKVLSIASKTTYYLNVKTIETGITELRLVGSYATIFIRAICAYL